MNNLVTMTNGEATVTSRQVAENFGRLHKDVLENIRGILVAEISATKLFKEISFEYRGQLFPEYIMNRDGFTLLAMGFQGSKALQWKLTYIAAFNEMEKQLSKPQLPDFGNPVIAVRAWADEVEAKLIVESQCLRA